MLRYQFVIALITRRATYGDDVCLVACSLFGIIAQVGVVCQEVSSSFFHQLYVYLDQRFPLAQDMHS